MASALQVAPQKPVLRAIGLAYIHLWVVPSALIIGFWVCNPATINYRIQLKDNQSCYF